MEHRGGSDNGNAPSSWFSGPAWQAPGRDQVHHGHHPPRDPQEMVDGGADAGLGTARTA
jgi:hypothetical protein